MSIARKYPMMTNRCPRWILSGALFCLCAAAVLAGEAADNTAPPSGDGAAVRVVSRGVSPRGTVVVKFSNGLTAVIRASRALPVVSVRAYVRAGAIYEKEWLGCGLSHLAEHLVSRDRIKNIDGMTVSVKETGGAANAYTTVDHTCYYLSAASTRWRECTDLVVGMVARPRIPQKEFEAEHGVVQRELEMGLDETDRVIYYTHADNLYRGHPAGVPTIGYAAPLSRLTRQDVLDYIDRMYTPDNIVIAVAGDIDTGAVVDRIARQARGFTRKRIVDYDLPDIPPLAGVRRIVKPSALFRETAECLTFRTVPLLHDDLYALDTLSFILSRGKSSRLVKTLQYGAGLVTAVESWSYTPAWGAGAFTVLFRAAPEKAAAAEAALLDSIEEIRANGVTEEELAKAKNQKKAEHARSHQKMSDIAAAIGRDYLMTGNPDFSDTYNRKIKNVTVEDIHRAAVQYLDPRTMAVTRIVPEKAYTPPAGTGNKKSGTAATTFSLPNGMAVALRPNPDAGLVSAVLTVKGGLLQETPETNGLGSLMTAMSTRGAGNRSGEDIARFFDAAGGSISGECGDDAYTWRISVLSDRMPEAMEILADVVCRPRFPEPQLEKVRPLILADITRQDEDWFPRLTKFFRRTFFAGTPWSMLTCGSTTVVSQATAEDIARHHRQHVTAGNACLAVCGDFNRSRTRALIDRLFKSLPEGSAPVDTPKPIDTAAGTLFVKKTNMKQAGIIVATPGTSMANKNDRLALMLIDTVISGFRMPSGWLHSRLRGQQLVYVVHAYHKTGLIPGAFLVYAGTQPSRAARVISIIRDSLHEATEHAYTRGELDLAIKRITGSRALTAQTTDAVALRDAENLMYGLGLDWTEKLEKELRALSPEQVQSVAKKYLSGGYVTTVITPLPDALEEGTNGGNN